MRYQKSAAIMMMGAFGVAGCVLEQGALTPQQPADGEHGHDDGGHAATAPDAAGAGGPPPSDHDVSTAEHRTPFDTSELVRQRCTQMVPLSGDIDTDTTLGPDCYDVSGRIAVEATVTIEPGATFVFGSDGGLDVRTDGRLRAAGEPGNEIIFTSDERIPGYWRGLRYGPSNSTHNVLSHVVVEYGGSRAWGLRQNRGGPANLSIDRARLEIDTVTLQHGSEYGLWIRSFEAITMHGDSTITGNEVAPVRTIPNGVGVLSAQTSYAGNGNDYIEVRGGDVDDDAVWPNFNVPLYVANTVVVDEAHLAIVGGNELIFRQDAGMDVRTAGSLAVDGTDQLPVVFRGEEAIEGLWQGIRYGPSNSRENRLTHVVIRDGGSEGWGLRRNRGHGNLSLDGARMETAYAITLENSGNVGIYMRGDPVFQVDCRSLVNPDGFNVDTPPC